MKRKLTLLIAITLLLCAMTSFTLNTYATSSEEINYFGTVIPCKKDSGYVPDVDNSEKSLWEQLTTAQVVKLNASKNDPHNGWDLGSFYVKGFSGMTRSDLNSSGKTMPVYLKNAGDTVSFGFRLDQDINKLNGDDKLMIYDDHKVVQDCWVQDPYVNEEIGKGLLIVVHTDYQGNQKITTYSDFLVGKTVGANTEVNLFEEGDYRVVLCYEIYKNNTASWLVDWLNPTGSWYNYRMEAYFSIRNGNAMVFPLDLETGAELQNKEVTPNGFKVDLANSHYLQLTIKKEVLNSAGTGILEDTRFNKVISDNSVFDQEGKYTISVTNLYTGLKTEKIIYVGNNPIMKCHMITGLTIEEINVFLNQGYTIGEDGKLIAPLPPPPTTGNSSTQTPNYTPDNNSNTSTNYPDQNSSGCSLTFSHNSAVFILLVLLTTVACTIFNRRERKK